MKLVLAIRSFPSRELARGLVASLQIRHYVYLVNFKHIEIILEIYIDVTQSVEN